ncbi:MAG TPA: alpha/beta hydrolase [Chitinophaga sp.]|uniref:alpha/beta hydrolase n=1 Tax=Chitinophaga sp. TaxID=1869181 RepID=UPI002BD95AE5|nr:alpha/beta hydrolase [Chitinophaga sp.]HVI47194.1 alpha/beta hydrolase [Chitinophaga sp.]
MMNRVMLLSAAMWLLHGCSQVKPSPAGGQVEGLPEKKMSDVRYGDWPRNVMDVYLPAGRSPATPFALLIHGGGWVAGSKDNVRDYQDTLLKRGIAVASINHRYADGVDTRYPQIMEDAANALEYCISHAKEWNTRSSGFVTTGISAGGHVATLYAYTAKEKINAVVDFTGPADLTDTATLNIMLKSGVSEFVRKLTGTAYTPGQPVPPAYADASPVSHVKPLPILLIYGTADAVVPYRQGLIMDSVLTARGVPHGFISVQGAGHDLRLNDNTNRSRLYNEAVKWMQQYGK